MDNLCSFPLATSLDLVFVSQLCSEQRRLAPQSPESTDVPCSFPLAISLDLVFVGQLCSSTLHIYTQSAWISVAVARSMARSRPQQPVGYLVVREVEELMRKSLLAGSFYQYPSSERAFRRALVAGSHFPPERVTPRGSCARRPPSCSTPTAHSSYPLMTLTSCGAHEHGSPLVARAEMTPTLMHAVRATPAPNAFLIWCGPSFVRPFRGRAPALLWRELARVVD